MLLQVFKGQIHGTSLASHVSWRTMGVPGDPPRKMAMEIVRTTGGWCLGCPNFRTKLFDEHWISGELDRLWYLEDWGQIDICLSLYIHLKAVVKLGNSGTKEGA